MVQWLETKVKIWEIQVQTPLPLRKLDLSWASHASLAQPTLKGVVRINEGGENASAGDKSRILTAK